MEGNADDALTDGLGHCLGEGASFKYGEEDKEFGLRYDKLESYLLNIIVPATVDGHGIQDNWSK